MKNFVLTNRRRWVVLTATGVMLIAGTAAATTAIAHEPTSSTKATGQSADKTNVDDKDGSDDKSGPAEKTKVSAADAAKTASDEISGAVVSSVELTDDSHAWDVELVTSNHKEHEVLVDVANGDINDHASEADDPEDWNELNQIAGASKLSLNKAANAALDKVDGTVTSAERDGTKDSPQWEISVTADNVEHEVAVNAVDGSILNHQTDHEDSDDD